MGFERSFWLDCVYSGNQNVVGPRRGHTPWGALPPTIRSPFLVFSQLLECFNTEVCSASIKMRLHHSVSVARRPAKLSQGTRDGIMK